MTSWHLIEFLWQRWKIKMLFCVAVIFLLMLVVRLFSFYSFSLVFHLSSVCVTNDIMLQVYLVH